MRKGPVFFSHILLLGMFALSARERVHAQAEGILRLNGTWQTDEVELTDGRTLRGLIEEESEQRIKFLEMRRRPGRPVTLVGHSLSRPEIVGIERLPEDARSVLRARLQAVRNRAAIEAGRAQNVRLEEFDRDGTRFSSYQGWWFRIEASLDPSEVRRIVVRLEQMFRAFEQVLPPPGGYTAAEGDISVVVFGDHRQYAAFLRREGLAIRNPAFFDPARGRVVVSSNLSRVLRRARAIEDAHLLRLRDLFPKDEVVAAALADRDKRLEKGGYGAMKRRDLLFLTLQRWRQEEDALVTRMRRVERRNRDAVQAERESLEKRLFHEAFHAYTSTRFESPHNQNLPRWLSEGLAQLFESPLLEADLLRIDAPDPERLVRLLDDFDSADPLTLADLLAADQAKFLVAHDASGRTSERHYLYAWAVAYYLVFEHSPSAMRQLGEGLDGSLFAIADFEEFVGMPMETFEARWRTRMRELARAHE